MDWNSCYLPLYLPEIEKNEPSLGATLRSMIVSALIAIVILFSVGVAFDGSHAVPEAEQAISASVPGSVALSCKHVRWCSKPIRRHYIGGYPLVVVERHGV